MVRSVGSVSAVIRVIPSTTRRTRPIASASSASGGSIDAGLARGWVAASRDRWLGK